MYSDLRRLLASLDFRFALVVRGASTGFAEFSAGAGVRTPIELVQHMCHLVDLIQEQFGGGTEKLDDQVPFDVACAEFRTKLRHLDSCLAAGEPFRPKRPEMGYEGLLQGPVSDALTHIGQLAMLRRLAGSPVERVRYWQVEMPLPSERAE